MTHPEAPSTDALNWDRHVATTAARSDSPPSRPHDPQCVEVGCFYDDDDLCVYCAEPMEKKHAERA